MTTPLVPEVPGLPGAASAATPAEGGHRGSTDRTVERSSVPALLLLLGLALVLAARAVPVASLATVTVLLLVAVAALARDTARADTSPAAGTPAAGGTTCRLEDASDTLRCHRPAGHTGTHYDARAGRVFRDTLVDHIGDAGAYYLDRQGRPVPVGDAF